MFRQQANGGPVTRTNGELQDLHQLDAAQGPAAAKHPVVIILDAYPRVFLKDIEFFHQFLNVDEFDLPGKVLGLDRHIQGGSCGAVTAASVEKAKLDFWHRAGVWHYECHALLKFG